ncbi:universal stress protein [Haloechinothrix halophila]|uniref:universal stress protein n=1 Tax=Haloechinothrix halophila TaxID=1069073 RepID=UPI0005561AE7|nr:universal stress protein [Haloechinothrix halophila]
MTQQHQEWIGPVVVGVDGSQSALRAVRWAAREASGHRVGLRVVHAIGVPEFFPGGAISPSTELYHLLEQDSESVLREAEVAAEEVAPGVEVQSESTMDPPVIALIEASNSARSIVLGESGRGTFAGLLLGSTTVTLAAHAHCPVIAVRGDVDRPADAPVVVGVDGSELSEHALGCAFEQAAFRGVRLVAMHAYTDADAKAVFSEARMAHDWEPLEQAEERILAERLAGWSELYPDVTVERDLVRSKPRERLLEWSESACLVVVGSRGRGGFSGLLLGSTSQALLHHAYCPVLVVRADPGQ